MSDTEFDPAAARLDQETENELYALYRAYFVAAEDLRSWNVWETIPWGTEFSPEPSEELINALTRCYESELFLPDYMATLLKHLRSSRARAWYTTRWAYEEAKHLLGLGEWLLRRGFYTPEELHLQGEAILNSSRWQPVSFEATALFVDALLYETQEIIRYRELHRLAEAEKDNALVTLTDRILTDEAAQQEFFAKSLGIIGKRYPEKVDAAIEIIASAQPDPDTARRTLRALLDLPA